MKYLGEKLIDRDTPVLKNAIEAFRTMKSDLFGSGDTDCDQYAATGSDIIMAACVARAGYEASFDISKEIAVSLESFRRVTEVDSVTDIVKIRKRRPERVNPQGIAYAFPKQGICRVNFCENTLKGMGTYSGGQLEEDWKSKTRKLCDVTYRAMVILSCAGRI